MGQAVAAWANGALPLEEALRQAMGEDSLVCTPPPAVLEHADSRSGPSRSADSLTGADAPWLSCLDPTSGEEAVLGKLATLYAAGARVPWPQVDA